MAGPITRGPLFVTTPTPRRWQQPDLFPNIAASLGVIAAATLHPLLDPSFYRKPAQQLDFSRNTPALAQAPPALVIQQQADPNFYARPRQQPDVYNNIAAQFPLVVVQPAVTRAPLYISTNYRQWAAPDVLPNIAAQAFQFSDLISHSPDPSFYPRRAPQIDIIYNVALALAPSQTTLTAEDWLPPKIWPQVEVFPNIAVGFTFVFYKPPSPIDPPPPKRYWNHIDLYPNVALRGVEPARAFPVLEWVLPTRKWPVPDIVPNPSLFNFPPLLFQQPDPVLTKRLWATFEQYRNSTVLAPIEKVPLIEPIDPWTNKRYPPELMVFQNKAIYVPAAPIPPLVELIEPWINKSNRWTQIDSAPNTALLVTTQLTPVPIFIWLNGEPVIPNAGLKYLYWHPTLGETLLLPATGMTTITPIPVGASPFIWKAPQNLLVLLGTGQLTSVVYNGIYPPNAPAGWVTPPVPGTPFVLNFDSGNDLAIPVSQGATLTITYTRTPLMYTVR